MPRRKTPVWQLTHYGLLGRHMVLKTLVIIGPGNGLSPDRCQTNTGTNVKVLTGWPVAINFNENFTKNKIACIEEIVKWKCRLQTDDHFVQPSCQNVSRPTETMWPSYMTISFIRFMMTPSNGNIFRVTGRLWGEFTGHRWSSLTKASDAELWCFLWSAPEQTIE